MEDSTKFDELKQNILKENEEKYGQEARERYGEEVVEKANEQFANMDPKKYSAAARLSVDINAALVDAVKTGDPNSPEARRLCEMHKEWLNYFWPEGMYTPEAHLALAEMYCTDARFTAYYDDVVEGGAQFLFDALKAYLAK